MSHILEFLDLVDVPNTFSGFPSAYVKVNSGATALEFVVDDTFHAGTASEISELDTVAVAVDDYVLIEDNSDSNNKKYVSAQAIAGLVVFDGNALHDDVANEITGITQKATIVDEDEFLLEDSEASFNKRSVIGRNLAIYVENYITAAGFDTTAIHDDTANEITAITPKTTLVDADEFILEDSGASFVKKAVTAANLSSYVETDLGGPFLPLIGGSLTGTLKVDDIEEYTTSHGIDFGHDIRVIDGDNPRILLAEGGSATTYLQMSEDGDSIFTMRRITDGSTSTINISADPNATGTGTINFFNGVVTTGSLDFQIYAGATVTHKFEADTGSVYFNTGNLFLDKSSDPTIFLRQSASATNYAYIKNNATWMYIGQVSSGNAAILIDPLPAGTNSAEIMLFSETNTINDRLFEIYEGDGTTTIQHSFNAGTGVIELCKQGGSLTVEEGSIYVDKTSTPAVYLREAAAATDYTRLMDSGTTSTWLKLAATGGSVCSIRPQATDGTSLASVDMFRTTTTSGSRNFIIYEGSGGDATVQHTFNAGTGDVTLCQQAGGLYIDTPTLPTLYLREGASATDYSTIKDGGSAMQFAKFAVTGESIITFSPVPSDGSSDGYVRVFRNTNTTGDVAFEIFEGSGSATLQHDFYGSTGAVALCQQAGQVTIGDPAAASNLVITSESIKVDSTANYRRYINAYSGYLGSANQVGAIVIRPFGAAAATAATMFHFVVSGYTWESSGERESDGPWCMAIGGYVSAAGVSWSEYGRLGELVYGNPPVDLVRLARDASGYHCIVIGETDSNWDYPTLTVDAQASFGGADDWDASDCTVAIDSSLTSFTFDKNQPLYVQERMYVKNTTGSSIALGSVCYISGASGERPLITLADADAAATGTKKLVRTLVVIANNGVGEVLTRGMYSTSSLTPSNIFYLSTTAGQITATAPSGSGDIVRVVGYAMTATRLWFDPSKSWTVV